MVAYNCAFIPQILQFLRTFKAQIPVRDPGRFVMGYFVEIVSVFLLTKTYMMISF